MRIFKLLVDANIKFSLEKEEIGTREDSQIAVLIAALLHDLGMSVARDKHEFMSIHLATPIIERILLKFYPEDFEKRVILRSLIIEGILGHMATQKVHSLEAGLVLVGDGCDMTKGRARIPELLSTKPKVGDIHRYSSSAINKVTISKGENKPVKIEIRMKQSVGFFQIEEVLFPKISSSTVKPHIELYAGLNDQDLARYL
jgi:metal-dependent HD superfamily phosphatase/phosphodiesterase